MKSINYLIKSNMLKNWHQPLQYTEYCEDCGAIRDRSRKTPICDQCGGKWVKLEVEKVDDNVHYFCSDRVCKNCGKRELKPEEVKCYCCMVEGSVELLITEEETEILKKMYPNCEITTLAELVTKLRDISDPLD